MRSFLKIVMISAVVLAVFDACQAISSFKNEGKVVAKVGKHRLTESEVKAYIPEGVSSEDSLQLAMQYINTWASDRIFSDVAEEQLSKAEKDVTVELEDYRKALLKYRYEQRYINERLDTSITEGEIEEYYQQHKEDFKTDVPLVKARFLRISSDSPNIEIIKKKMSSADLLEQAKADSLAYTSADKYTDYGMRWIDMLELAKDFGTDYGSLLSKMKKSFIEESDEYGKKNIAYISEYIRAGEIAPVEYCSARIRDILIGVRKHRLVSTLEQDLLDDAREKGRFIIY